MRRRKKQRRNVRLTCICIKVFALSFRGQHVHLMELKSSHRSETDVDSSNDSLITLSCSESKDCLLESKEGRRTSSIHCIGWSLKIEGVRDTIGEHGSRASCECVS